MTENFDPITEGTPEEFYDETARTDLAEYLRLIAARDAAMRAKGFAEGRLKGLEEAAEIAETTLDKMLWGWDGDCNAGNIVPNAIRRAAAEKEGGENG